MKDYLLRHLSKDHFAGGLALIVGLGATYYGRTYEFGTLGHMGPGFFPVMLGVVMAFLGMAIMLTATPIILEKEKVKPRFEWRGWMCILLAFVAFIVLLRFGLIPATTAIVMISAFGERKNTLISALILTIAMNLIAIVVFKWALQMPIPLFSLAE